MYIICEIGIIATDLAELLGSAIGLTLLAPSLPLWASVLITSFDVVFVLALAPSSAGRPVRAFEAILMALVLVVFVIFIVLLVKIQPNMVDVLNGYLPSKTLFQPGALYTSIGILGATVMPHAIFLGSSLATLDRVSPAPSLESLPTPQAEKNLTLKQKISRASSALFYVERKPKGNPVMHTRGADMRVGSLEFHSRDEMPASPIGQSHLAPTRKYLNNSVEFIKEHLGHAVIDIGELLSPNFALLINNGLFVTVMSLLGFAVIINSAILVLAAAAFFYSGRNQDVADAGLFDAHDLIRDMIGKPAAVMFAVALLCSGQSASITATLAGQIVSEGFIEWRVSPFVRRIITRLIGLVPSTIVAVTVGRQGIDVLLVASQVALSIVLPFVIFPLVYLTSQQSIMEVAKPSGEVVSYKSSIVATAFGYLIFVVVVVANSYGGAAELLERVWCIENFVSVFESLRTQSRAVQACCAPEYGPITSDDLATVQEAFPVKTLLMYKGPGTWSSRSRFRGKAPARGTGILTTSDPLRTKRNTPTKRKRAHFFPYDSSSDTEEEDCPRPEAKRVCHAEPGVESAVDRELLDLAGSGQGDLDEGLGRQVGEKETEGGKFECPDMEPAANPGIDDDCDEHAVEYAQSAEGLEEVDFDDSFESRADPNGFPWEDALSAVELWQTFNVQEYLTNLPLILTRRADANPVARSFDEPLRVILLAKHLKRRIYSGRLTSSELDELAAQRSPSLIPTAPDIPNPELSSEEEVPESWDSDDFEEEDSSLPARPSTPLPPGDSDSDSDSDSDDDGPPVYSNKEIFQHMSRREMEKQGIYPDEE
ncbi:hypothetical protein FRC10_001607 [Ceratobasidium sp. 414]|nr:hypothetical protein FRC10_001607 [Ceratobasidium sp. 414]